MLGTYVMYLDIGRDDGDDCNNGEPRDEDYYASFTDTPLSRL